MKRFIAAALLISFTFLTGCGRGNGDKFDIEDSFFEEIDYSDIDISSVEETKGRDNTLDEYTAVVHTKFSIIRQKGEVGGGFDVALDGQRASYLIKHLFTDVSACYDEVEIVTKEGEDTISTHYREEKYPVWMLGKCYDENLRLEIGDKMGDERTYFFARILDSNNETVNEISLEKVVDEYSELLIPCFPVLDLNNNLHFFVKTFDTDRYVYYIFSSDSEVLYSKEFEENICVDSIDLLTDGKAVLYTKELEIGKKYEHYDYSVLYCKAKNLETLCKYSVPISNEPFVYLKDSESIIAADNTGIYSCNRDFSDKKALYLWMNHGIRVNEVIDLCEQGSGIGAIYRESDTYSYIYLEPVKEKTEIKQITLAVSENTKRLYNDAVIDFNKNYPNYNILLKEYIADDALLLTELNSGEGPVLVDTSLTGFDDKKKLWEPLDKVLEGMEFYDKLNAEALEFGKIDGHIYGIVTEFYINTLYCNDGSDSDWNYDSFIRAAANEKISYLINSEVPESDRIKTAVSFFVHGLADSYYINCSDNTTVFGTDDFKELMSLINQKVSGEQTIEPRIGSDVLCTGISLTRPSDLYGYMSALGEDVKFTGYPHKDGGYSVITGRMPIAIRKNASLEEKEIACVFIKTLLSYESQAEKVEKVDAGFSIRNDVIAEQIEAFNDDSIYVTGFGNVRINEAVTKEKVKKKLNEILAKSKAGKSYPRELNAILIEELSDYFGNRITEEELAKHLENRVSLYLEEQSN